MYNKEKGVIYMELRHFEYFVMLCEMRSINAAAKKLYISQQALSKNIDSIEQELGQALFIRSPKGIQLTDAGEVFLGEAKEILRRHEHMIARMNHLKTGKTSVLKLSFYSGMLYQLGQNFMENFMLSHPDVQIHLFSYLDTFHARESANYDVDLFFSSNRLSQNSFDLLYEYHAPLCALLSENHRFASCPVLHLDDLQDETIITLNADYDTKNLLAIQLERHNVTVDYCLGDTESNLIYWLVCNQNAVSFFAGPDNHLPNGTVKKQIEDLLVPWNFFIYGKRGHLSPVAEELIESIKAVRECK